MNQADGTLSKMTNLKQTKKCLVKDCRDQKEQKKILDS